MEPQHRPSCRAFTLLELLLVIAVVLILGALLMVGLSAGMTKARLAHCRSNVHQQAVALMAFVADHHVYPLHLNPNYSKSEWPDQKKTWEWTILPDGFGPVRDQPLPVKDQKPYRGVFNCPAMRHPDGLDAYSSYGYNAFGVIGAYGQPSLGLSTLNWDKNNPFGPPVPESLVVSPSKMFALGDGAQAQADGKAIQGGSIIIGLYYTVLNRPASVKEFNGRHRGQMNVSFCDGHIQTFSVKAAMLDHSTESLSRWNRDGQAHTERLGQ